MQYQCIRFLLPLIIGHLIWVTIAVGLHSFSVYLHNDILQGFWRPEDMWK